jgi:hypothetical protein
MSAEVTSDEEGGKKVHFPGMRENSTDIFVTPFPGRRSEQKERSEMYFSLYTYIHIFIP